MVEAPGTAPGSEWFIPTAIYRHSRQAGDRNIEGKGGRRKGMGAFLQCLRAANSGWRPSTGDEGDKARLASMGHFIADEGSAPICGVLAAPPAHVVAGEALPMRCGGAQPSCGRSARRRDGSAQIRERPSIMMRLGLPGGAGARCGLPDRSSPQTGMDSATPAGPRARYDAVK